MFNFFLTVVILRTEKDTIPKTLRKAKSLIVSCLARKICFQIETVTKIIKENILSIAEEKLLLFSDLKIEDRVVCSFVF